MGIHDFVSMLQRYHPTTQVTPPRTRPPRGRIIGVELCPLLHTLRQTRDVRLARERRVLDEQELDNVPVIDGNTEMAVTAFHGTFRTDEVVAMLVEMVMSSLVDGSAVPGRVVGYVVSDSSDELPLKEETRRARVMQWLSSRRRRHPDTPDDKLRYPQDAELVPEGVSYNQGRTVELIDIDVMLHSSRKLYTQLMRLVHDAIMTPPLRFAGNMFLLVDIGEGLPPGVVIGRDFRAEDIPIEIESIRLDIAEAVARTEPKSEVYVFNIPELRTHFHHTIEGDLGLIKVLPSLMRSPFGLRYCREPTLVRTIDTDVAMLILYHGEQMHLNERTVYWSSPVSGTWDLSAIYRRMRTPGSDTYLLPSALMTASLLSGCDFFQKKWVTDGIGTPALWRAALVMSVSRDQPVLGTPSYLDAFLRAVQTVVLDAQPSIVSASSSSGSNCIELDTWEKLRLVEAEKTARVRPASKSKSKSAKATTPSASSPRQRKKGVRQMTDYQLHAVSSKYARVVSYWVTMGATTDITPELNDHLEALRKIAEARGHAALAESVLMFDAFDASDCV